jgi:hypothetical protein
MARIRFVSLLVAVSLIYPAAAVADATAMSAVNAGALGALAPAAAEPQLQMMQASGVQLVRADASWNWAEPAAPGPSGHTYQFAADDVLVAELASHQMTWLPTIDYSAPWMESIPGAWNSPPADDAQYAAYAQALAARYGDHGSFWSQNPQLPYKPVRTFEVWNEENTSMFWANTPDAGRYALLYQQTRAQIRAVDPSAQVIVGGLLEITPGPASRYVQAMFRALPALRGHVDGFALHPYGMDAAGVLDSVRAFRQTLDGLGEAAAPIDITEFGWSIGAGESWRARTLRTIAASLANSDCGVAVLAPYTWFESAGSGDNYSLTTANGLLPSARAWFTGLSASARSPAVDLCHPLRQAVGFAAAISRPVTRTFSRARPRGTARSQSAADSRKPRSATPRSATPRAAAAAVAARKAARPTRA